MGIEKDYLIRQLMMLFEVFQKILRYRIKGEKENAEKEIDYFFECLRIDSNFHTKGIEELINYLEVDKNLSSRQLELVSFVLKEMGEMEQDAKIKLDFFRKSYFILQKTERESTSFSIDRQMKIEELKEILKN